MRFSGVLRWAACLAAGSLLALGPLPVSKAQKEGAKAATGSQTEPGEQEKSIEVKTRVHRLSSTNRAVYDAFVYVNRIPESPENGESASDHAGRVFGRLANQEGRILLKLPPGMDRDAYLALKTFLRYEAEGAARVGNCAACHTPVEFTDLKEHIVTKGGLPKPTPSLRNLSQRKVDVAKAVTDHITASQQKQAGDADEIDDAYAKMNIRQADVPGLLKFLNHLNDLGDASFRRLILDAELLDTSEDIE